MASRREITKLLSISGIAAFVPASRAWGAQAESPIVARVAPPGSLAESLWSKFDSRLFATDGVKPRLAASEDRASDPAIFAAIAAGRAHLGAVLTQSIAPQIPVFAVLRLPYLFGSEVNTIKAFNDTLLALVQPYLDPFGVTALGWIESGWLEIYSNRVVLEPSQLKGLPVRRSAGDTTACLARVTGAVAVDIPYREIGTAIGNGHMVGGEFTLVELVSGRSVVAAAPQLTLTNHAYGAGMVLVNTSWFEAKSLTERRHLKAIIPSYVESRQVLGKRAAEFLQERRALGMVHDLSARQRKLWQRALIATHGPALDQIGTEGTAFYKKLQRL